METLYAHYNYQTKSKQTLVDHLQIVAEQAALTAEVINQQDIMYLIGLFHDLGKADPLFQNMMLKQTKEKINHSSAGASYLCKNIPEILNERKKEVESQLKQSFVEIVGYVITAHHGLYDIPCDLPEKRNSNFYKRITYFDDKRYSYNNTIINFANELEEQILIAKGDSLDELVVRAFENFCELWNKIKSEDASENAFYRSLIIRLYLSLLKNADILDTINAFQPIIQRQTADENQKLIDSYVEKIENKYMNFPTPVTALNKVRMELADEILSRGQTDETGIYRLSLPTGAGKTNLSMRYGFHQLLDKGKKRFIYITSYLSVLEQNALEVKKVTGSVGVLEHHSNIVQPEESEQIDESLKIMTNYLVETWDSPIVLSTMVQFFQTLFKGKSGNIRRFSQLINSVIILDEVQSLPIEVTTLFNLTMNFLKNAMNTTIVLCTATQPSYASTVIRHRIQYGNQWGKESELIELTENQRKIFERTLFYKMDEENEELSIEEISSHIQQHLDKSILVILNTKAAVKKLYERVKSFPVSTYYLSTNMCAKHRFDRIAEIKDRLKAEKTQPLICLSTQLIEAGVDLDFDYVIRSYSGIDSIVQAAGRCNREGKKESGYVQLVNVAKDEESLNHLPSIKHKKEVTEQILRTKHSPIAINELNDEFFERYFSNAKPDTFDYLIGDNGRTVYSMLSDNRQEYQVKQLYLKQSFKTAAQKMDLIQEESRGVLVYYDKEDSSILNELIEELNEYSETYQPLLLKSIKKKLRQLQPYTVNIRKGSNYEEAIISYLDGSIQILQEDFYSKETGVVDQMGKFIL